MRSSRCFWWAAEDLSGRAAAAAEYLDVTGVGGYRSGDYRLNQLASHLFGGALRMDLDALAPSRTLVRRLSVWLDVERYFNSNNYSANVVETGVDFRFP